MENFILETSTIFDEIVEELGLDAISDLDITDELRRHPETINKKGTILEWDYDFENKILNVTLEA